jgi:hypothetical protein
MFKLSKRSLSRLSGVDENLQDVIKLAIKYTSVDFGVTQGLRTKDEQLALFSKGVTQTLDSKHLTGDAVDLIAYSGSSPTWNSVFYISIADAVKKASKELGVSIRWGAAWHISDFTNYNGSAQDATDDYVKRKGREAFLDFPHFELS